MLRKSLPYWRFAGAYGVHNSLSVRPNDGGELDGKSVGPTLGASGSSRESQSQSVRMGSKIVPLRKGGPAKLLQFSTDAGNDESANDSAALDPLPPAADASAVAAMDNDAADTTGDGGAMNATAPTHHLSWVAPLVASTPTRRQFADSGKDEHG